MHSLLYVCSPFSACSVPCLKFEKRFNILTKTHSFLSSTAPRPSLPRLFQPQSSRLRSKAKAGVCLPPSNQHHGHHTWWHWHSLTTWTLTLIATAPCCGRMLFFFPSDPHTQVGYLCANIYDARAREHAQQMGTTAKKNLFLFEGWALMNNLLFLYWFCFSVVKKDTGHIAAIYRKGSVHASVPDGDGGLGPENS